MPLLLRSSHERNSLRRVAMVFLLLTMQLASHDELEGAFAMFDVCQAAARMLAQPSRRHAAVAC